LAGHTGSGGSQEARSHVGRCVELNPTGFWHARQVFDARPQKDGGREKLTGSEVVRRRVNMFHGGDEETLGLGSGKEKHDFWPGFRHGDGEAGLGAADGPEVHGCEAGVASTGRVARAHGRVSDCAHEVGPTAES
jgi:hypothetical protein